MEPLVFGLCMWLLLQVSQQNPMLDVETRRANRQKAHEFIEDKLIEQGQALEFILKAVQKNEDLTKRLIDNLSMRLSPPELPEKIEDSVPESRRRNNEPVTLHPVEQFSNMISRFGNLAKDGLLVHMRFKEKDPIVLVDEN